MKRETPPNVEKTRVELSRLFTPATSPSTPPPSESLARLSYRRADRSIGIASNDLGTLPAQHIDATPYSRLDRLVCECFFFIRVKRYSHPPASFLLSPLFGLRGIFLPDSSANCAGQVDSRAPFHTGLATTPRSPRRLYVRDVLINSKSSRCDPLSPTRACPLSFHDPLSFSLVRRRLPDR